MWRALRTELVYFGPWLLGGLGIAAFVVVLLSVLTRFLGEGGGPPVFVAAMMPIIAGMVVSFIAQSYRTEERRARLLLAGNLVPRQLAGVLVLLPLCFVGIGTLAAVPMIGFADLISGTLEPSNLMVVAGFAGQFLAYAQLGPLAQESIAARRQGRRGAAVTGWGGVCRGDPGAGGIPDLPALDRGVHGRRDGGGRRHGNGHDALPGPDRLHPVTRIMGACRAAASTGLMSSCLE